MKIHLKMSGATKRRLLEMRANAATLSEPLRIIAQDLLRSCRRNFQAQGRRDEATNLWARHSPTTIARRRKGQKRGGARLRILENTGRLKQSLTTRSGTTWAAVGTTVEYASDHQQGGRWGARKRIRRLVRIPAHQATRLVGQDYDAPQADPAHHFVKAGAFDLKKRDLQRKANKLRARKAAHAKAGQPKRRKPRHLRRQKVPVRAHTQLQNYLLPARPFLWIHRTDVARARQRVTTWIMRRRKAAA